ncbi:uncharacterized protein LOC109710640 isoform X1 [Ananas comosus]|uniref:Uncharacterized protein LOC109710640 isoform X1 n=1 Tax=Ananas comosus TaxID=4615 RepID=A0A6P5EYN8_ANACO|nr:uncharacterized protein LOC109710640 isoform X1 [Ananas comosus]
MATKAAYSILTFFLLLSGYLVHSATAARVIWLTPSPPWTGRHAWLTPSPPLPQPEHSGIDVATLVGDKDTLGTMDEPRGEPYNYTRGTTRGNPYTRAPAAGIPATRFPSGPPGKP